MVIFVVDCSRVKKSLRSACAKRRRCFIYYYGANLVFSGAWMCVSA